MDSVTDIKKAQDLIKEYRTLNSLRRYKRKFIPLEKIARDPLKFGYKIPARPETKARQEDFINSNAKISAVISGNRSGKTEAGVKKFLDICYSKKGEAWVCSPSYDLQKSGVQKKIMEFLKDEDIIHREYAVGQALKSLTIKHEYGKTIIMFKTFEQGREKVQSADIIAVLIDEEPKEEFFDEVYTRTLDHNAQVILTFTPLNGRTWTYNRIYNNPDVDIYSWGMVDNPFISMDEIEKMLKTLSWRSAQMRVHGQYVGSETAVWPMFERKLHIRPDLYDRNLPVDITIDFGVVTSACIFGQMQKVLDKGKFEDRFVIVDAIEMHDTGYGTMMQQILGRATEKNYIIGEWFCDPAGRQRGQTTRTGTSLLSLIKQEFGVEFSYMKKLGIEESIDIVASYMVNAEGKVRFYLNGDILVDGKNSLASRIEMYVRDNETHKPIDDDVVTHLTDTLRYWICNKVRGGGTMFDQR